MDGRDLFCESGEVHQDAVKLAKESMISQHSADSVSAIFKVLGDQTRVKIVWALDNTELCVCDIAETLGMSKSAVSHQLSTLRSAKVVKSRRDGKNIFYSLDDQHITDIIELALAHTEH